MKIWWLTVGAFVLVSPVSAQSPGDEALNAVRRLFDAMRAQDTIALKANLHPTARLITTGTNQQGQPGHQFVPIEGWVRAIANARARPDERIYDPEVRVDDNLATVWTRYDFFIGDAFSHCGYDGFQLAKVEGAWKVVHVSDTQRRTEARCGRGTEPVSEVLPTASDSAAVRTGLQKLFDAMAARDTAAVRASMLPNAQLVGLSATTKAIQPTSVNDFVAVVGRQQAPLHERPVNPEVRIHDNLATVWTWYDFHLGDRFSHCGIDAAQLVRTAEGWKIAQITYTGRPTPCDRPRD
jgi:hypothetical protein